MFTLKNVLWIDKIIKSCLFESQLKMAINLSNNLLDETIDKDIFKEIIDNQRLIIKDNKVIKITEVDKVFVPRKPLLRLLCNSYLREEITTKDAAEMLSIDIASFVDLYNEWMTEE